MNDADNDSKVWYFFIGFILGVCFLMGIDYYACDNCGDTFPDCGPYTHCEDCYRYLCSPCSDKMEIGSYRMSKNGQDDYDEDDEHGICPYCSGAIVTEEQLLEYALEKLGMGQDELEKELKFNGFR